MRLIGTSRCFFGAFVAAALLGATPSARAQTPGPDLGQAEQLIVGGKADEAWRLLSPHEFSLAGREDFDYLLGVAALESGRADLATLILERVLAVNPNHAAARLDMGRAYYTLGDFERARTEFDSVLRFDPPPAARATVERYLAAMEERRVAHGPRASGLGVTAYVEVVAGHDSNVNVATSQSSIFVPVFGVNFKLASSSTQTRDSFLALGVGGEATYAFDSGFGLFAGADLKVREHHKAAAYDYASGDVRIGAQYAGERDLLRATLSNNEYKLDGADYRRTAGTGLEWRRTLDQRTQVSVFAQESRIRYIQSTAQSYSSNLFIYGATAARTLDEASRTVAYAGFFRGTDSATDGRSDGDRRLYALRGGVQRALFERADVFANASVQKSTYEQQNAIFSSLRLDRQYDFSLGVNWQLDTAWLLRPQVSYTRNDSTLALNDYRRTEASLTLRRDWR